MRLHLNTSCNIVSGEHSQSRHGDAQITVPGLRARFFLSEAKQLRDDLSEAIAFIEQTNLTSHNLTKGN